jgi:hypothetical protein
MKPNIFGAGPAKTVPVKSGQRIATTTFQLSSQNICRHAAILALEIRFVKCWISENMPGERNAFFSMKRVAIAYWLVPVEPARSFFQKVINDLAQRYSAPVFEAHLTIYVGLNRADMAEKALSKAACDCKLVALKTLEIDHSSEFIQTLFVRFAVTTQLQQLNQRLRTAAQDSSDYQLNPHLSLLYKSVPIEDRCVLAHSIDVPFSEVTFDLLKAVRCISPTQCRADVEAWRVVAEKSLGPVGV